MANKIKQKQPLQPALIPPRIEEMKRLEDEVSILKERELIILQKYDSKSAKLDWAFNHPVRFMLGRVLHQIVKRDQKNVKD